MNRESYLNPGSVVSYATAAGSVLDNHIAACHQGTAVFGRAAGMPGFQGSAACAIKAQFQDCMEVFDLYISSARLVQSQITHLSSCVGDEILDGAVIAEGIELSEKACREHRNDSIAYREMALRITEPAMFACRTYLNHVADIYEQLSENDKRLAGQWREKAAAYDQIEGSTAGLFGGSIDVISKVAEGIAVISSAFRSGHYDTEAVGRWKNELTHVIYDSYRHVESDGTFSVNWSAVEASLTKPAEHITEAEYGALAALYSEMAPEDMGRFLGLLTEQTAQVDNYNRRLSAYGGNELCEDYSVWTFDQEKLAHLGCCLYYEKEALLAKASDLYEQASVETDCSLRREIYDEADHLLAKRSDYFKRYLILDLCEDLKTVRGGCHEDGPSLTAVQDMRGQYTFSWKNEGNVGQRLEIGRDIYSDMMTYTADISTYEGMFMSMYGNEMISETVLSQVETSTMGSVVRDFSHDQIKGKVTGAIMKEMADRLSREWISELPVFDVVEIPFSLYSEYKETTSYLNETGESLRLSELSHIYSAFDFEGGYVCIHGEKDEWMIQFQEGVRSKSLIEQMNIVYYDQETLKINDFKNKPDEVLNYLRALMEEGNDLDRIKIDAILSGAYQ